MPAVRAGLLEDGEGTQIDETHVLAVTPFGAAVYVVVPCSDLDSMVADGQAAFVVRLVLRRGHWTLMDYSDSSDPVEVVWSDCGSADGNIFPPYSN